MERPRRRAKSVAPALVSPVSRYESSSSDALGERAAPTRLRLVPARRARDRRRHRAAAPTSMPTRASTPVNGATRAAATKDARRCSTSSEASTSPAVALVAGYDHRAGDGDELVRGLELRHADAPPRRPEEQHALAPLVPARPQRPDLLQGEHRVDVRPDQRRVGRLRSERRPARRARHDRAPDRAYRSTT